jgi:alpha-tubulin suppressor-like RCC1 family protein
MRAQQDPAFSTRFETAPVDEGGGVYCWGENQEGQLGQGTRSASAAASRIEGIGDAIDVGAGEALSCALLRSGEVECWGSNASGALGLGEPVIFPVPVRVAIVSGCP